ncbi:MAG: asparaginase [Clostridia bacterium]|nr:asparaginase [Clostridia bacterium]
MKKILMLTTGGTIASRSGSEGLAPEGSEEILRHIGAAADSYDVTTREIFTLDSTNIQPEEWHVIASAIYDAFTDYDGIVVTHGTDTMAYTASMMSFMLQNPPVPVVFTGSQVPISHPLTDAIENLRCAFAMAASGKPGVFVAFDRKIMLGCRAVKVRTVGFDAFESVNCPPVALVDSTGLRLNPSVLPRIGAEPSLDDGIDTDVFLLKLTPATNPAILDMLLDAGIHGIVIEAFGAGGIQFIRRDFIARLERAAKAGIPVVVCSQCLYEASELSIYQVGVKALETGAIQAHDMTSEATVAKLMWALGKSRDIASVRKLFGINFAGEVSLPVRRAQ